MRPQDKLGTRYYKGAQEAMEYLCKAKEDALC
jgi:hypothetical protein